MNPLSYDRATDQFCRALGLKTETVSHLAVGPNYTVARVMTFDDNGRPTGDEVTVRIGRDKTRIES